MGLDQTTISKWESGSTIPEVDNFIALGEALNVSPGYLLNKLAGIENSFIGGDIYFRFPNEITSAEIFLIKEMVYALAKQRQPRILGSDPEPPRSQELTIEVERNAG